MVSPVRMWGQGAPFGAASHFLGQAGSGKNKVQSTKLCFGIISMGPTCMPSLGPIGQGTTAAEPPWAHRLAGEHFSKVPDLIILTKLGGPSSFCLINFVQKCSARAPRTSRSTPCPSPGTPDLGARGQAHISDLVPTCPTPVPSFISIGSGITAADPRVGLGMDPPVTWARSGAGSDHTRPHKTGGRSLTFVL